MSFESLVTGDGYSCYNGDCITVMEDLISDGVKVDLVLTDPPYGTLKSIQLKGWDNDTTKWDDILPTREMFGCCERLLRMNGVCVLFSQEPYTHHLRGFDYPNLPFIYPLYWVKDHFANNLTCNKAPVSYVEDLSVFRKRYDSGNLHPLREYSKNLLDFIGCSKKEIIDTVGGKADHFFRWGSSQFNLCTESTYDDLIDVYSIDECGFFKSYDELLDLDLEFKPIFNLGDDKKYKSNLLEYKKSYNHYHPTEKPVDLLEDLIKTYTNVGDVVLDFTMGSGSTGVACLNTGRRFVGIELDKGYFDVACGRLGDCCVQSTLDF